MPCAVCSLALHATVLTVAFLTPDVESSLNGGPLELPMGLAEKLRGSPWAVETPWETVEQLARGASDGSDDHRELVAFVKEAARLSSDEEKAGLAANLKAAGLVTSVCRRLRLSRTASRRGVSSPTSARTS
jgi:hypothetical protein